MAGRPKAHRQRLPRDQAAPFNGSTTSYEDIPETDSRLNVLSSSNRHSVMHALQNLQEKIHRLELDRSHAAGDMECLASETARFRRMLSVPEQDKGLSEENEKSTVLPQPYHVKRSNRFGFCPQAPVTDFQHAAPSITPTSRLPSASGHPDVIQPSLDFHNCGSETRLEAEAASDRSSNAEDEKAPSNAPFLYDAHRAASPPPLATQEGAPECPKLLADSSSVPSSYNLPPQTPQAVAIALTSAETRCSILEQQLSYMRTLLEAAERDRNEAQRRCRHRGHEFKTWRRSVEVQLGRLEADLSAERGRNRVLCEKASSPLRRTEETPDSAEDLPPPSERSEPPPKPSPAWQDVAAPRPRTARPCASPTRPRRASRGGPIPFVAGKATTPSHNVGLSLQAVMQMANRKASASAVTGVRAPPGAARRRQQADQVDRQLGRDVRVVLEELVDEFDSLCRVHGRCVRQLAVEKAPRAKDDLQHQLTDLVNRMDVKGQQIGRLRAYLASIEAPAAPSTEAAADAESERRARSIRFLNKARHLQSQGMHCDDLDWR